MAAITGLGVGGPSKAYGLFDAKTPFVPELPPRIVEYAPGPVPYNVTDHARYMQVELNRISEVLRILVKGFIQKTYVEPTAPRDGDTCYADGTSWNPGSGEGIYCYYNNQWNKL